MRACVFVFLITLMVFADNGLSAGKSSGSKEELNRSISRDQTKEATPAAKVSADMAEDKLLATVNGVKIMQSEVDKKIVGQLEHMKAMGRQPTEAIKENFRRRVVETMIIEQLVSEKIKASNIKVSEQEVKAKIEEIAAQQGMSVEGFYEMVGKQGITAEELKGQIKMGIGGERLLEKEMAKTKKAVSEEDAKKFYDENIQRFSQAEQVRASHILIGTTGLDEAVKAEAKVKIEGLLKRARAGEDFAELAKANSEDPGSKDKGGEYVFPRGQMVKEFEEAAFSLKPGEVSDVVQTQYGYHIIKLSEKLPAKTGSFEDVKGQVVEMLKDSEKGEFARNYIETLKSEAEIILPQITLPQEESSDVKKVAEPVQKQQ